MLFLIVMAIMKNPTHTIPWKLYLTITAETTLAFMLSTFSMGIYFTHLHDAPLFLSILMCVLYVFVIGVCIKRLVEKFSLPALMLMTPILPLLVLILVVAMLPLLQYLR